MEIAGVPDMERLGNINKAMNWLGRVKLLVLRKGSILFPGTVPLKAKAIISIKISYTTIDPGYTMTQFYFTDSKYKL